VDISEDYAKYGLKEKVRFNNITQGSTKECLKYLILSKVVDYGENKVHISPE